MTSKFTHLDKYVLGICCGSSIGLGTGDTVVNKTVITFDFIEFTVCGGRWSKQTSTQANKTI